jgi:CBS domain-containing protein
MMKTQEIMTTQVITVRSDSPLQDAIATMLEHGVSGVPVIDEHGQAVGMLSESDLLRRTELDTERRRPRWLVFLMGPGKLAEEYTHTHGRTVADVMTNKLYSVAPDTPVRDVVQLMERRRIKRLPVLENGQLVGIVSRANLLRALALATAALPAGNKSDEEIRERLARELASTEWAPRHMIDHIVQNGAVHLYGTILDEREREALCVAARNTPGVTEVHDHLVWCEPVSGSVLGLPTEPDQPRY